jgi:hypothetical protein
LASPHFNLLLLLALGVRLVAVLMSSLRVLLRGSCVLLALGVIALAVVFRRGSVGFGRVFVVLRSLIVLVSCHGRFPCLACSQRATKAARQEWFLPLPANQRKYF